MRLNIGCGPVQPDGWVNIDTDPQWGAIVLDPAGPSSQDRFGSAEGAVAHHVLQMVSWPFLVPWLGGVGFMLDAGAWLRLSVPDFPGAYAAALDGDRDWFPIADEIEPSIDGKLVTYLTQCGASRSLFTGPWLRELCGRAGFSQTRIAAYGQTAGPGWLTELDSREHESIYVEARR